MEAVNVLWLFVSIGFAVLAIMEFAAGNIEAMRYCAIMSMLCSISGRQ